MKKIIVAVRDLKAETFFQPIVADNLAVAMRNFADAAANPDMTIVKHPEDYALYRLGDYDMLTGIISGLDQPVHICSAEEMLRHA